MIVQEISEQEFSNYIKDRLVTPYQTPEMARRLALDGRNPRYFAGKEDGNIVIATMAGLYPFKRIFNYLYSPYGYVADEPLNTEQVREFARGLKEVAGSARTIAWKLDPAIEVVEMDGFGKPVEGGFDNRSYRQEMIDAGFDALPWHTEVPKLANPRQIMVIDLADLEHYDGAGNARTRLIRMHTPEEQKEKMKNRTQRYLKQSCADYIKVEDSDIDTLLELGKHSSEAKHFEFMGRGLFEKLQEGFGDKCHIRHCYIDTAAYRAHTEQEIEKLEQERETLKNKNARRKLQNIENQIQQEQEKLKTIDEWNTDKLSLACGFFIESDKEIIFLASGIDRRYRKYQGATRLNWDMIEYSMDHGIWRYNLLGIAGTYAPDDPNESLISFKRDLGAHIGEYQGTYFYPFQKLPEKQLVKEWQDIC